MKYFFTLPVIFLSLFCLETSAQENADIKMLEKENADNLELLMLELTDRFDTIDKYWRHGKPELAAELSEIQYQQLKNISSYDFPKKTPYLVQLGNLYYDFKDYSKAIFYFKEALNDSVHLYNQEQQMGAYNNLGLCYRYGFDDFDRSDSCFRAILQTKYLNPDEELKRDLWDAVATGNLGRNMLLRKEYDKALPLLLNSLEAVLKYNDHTYASRIVLDLADIYLQKNNPKEVKYYIDLFNLYNKKKNKSEYLGYLYEVKSKYYALTGNSKLAIMYLDSMLTENKKKEERFNALQLLRVEQRQHLSEQKLKEEQLNAEKIKSNGYKRSFIITIVALLLIAGVLAFYFVLYRKKKEAYLGLYHQIKEQDRLSEKLETMTKQYDQNMSKETQGHIETQFITSLPGNAQQRQLVSRLREYLIKDSYFATFDIDIQKLISEMNTNRGYFFKAIKEITGKTPMDFINYIRLDEAKKMLDGTNLTIETIAFECGFNTVRTFYRQFRERYNITPTEYRNIAKEQETH